MAAPSKQHLGNSIKPTCRRKYYARENIEEGNGMKAMRKNATVLALCIDRGEVNENASTGTWLCSEIWRVYIKLYGGG